MKKNANTRGYLSQLAQPLLPGEAVLKTRHWPPWVDPETAAVPVIEDQFEFVRHAPATPPSHQRTESNVLNQISPSAAVDNDRKLSPSIENPRTLSAPGFSDEREILVDPESAILKPPLLPGHTTAATTPPPSKDVATNVADEHSSPIIATHELSEPEASARNNRASSNAASISHAAGGQEVLAAHARSPEAREDPKAERNTKQPMPPAEVATRPTIEGRRVYIGTVEVRAVLPQPHAPPAPPAPSREAAPSPRANADEPLGRGLSWSYGLIQG